MTLPSIPRGSKPIVALDYEIAQEQASALGRLGRALEAALAALAEHDRTTAQGKAQEAGLEEAVDATRRRGELVGAASHALWCFLVQRECCGMRDPRPVIAAYRVPADVYNRIGAVMPGGFPRRRGKS